MLCLVDVLPVLSGKNSELVTKDDFVKELSLETYRVLGDLLHLPILV